MSPSARPALLAAALALLLYAVTLRGTFVFDDWSILVDDPRIENVRDWKSYFTRDYFFGGADNLYRPLVSLSYAIEAKLHGNSPARAWIYHLVNWLLHAGACALVAELARRMRRSTTAALIAGLLFAAHPIHVEAVANIVGRAELACAIGIFAALVLFFRPLTPARAMAIWMCFLLALLSKEQGMLVPLLLVLAIPARVHAVGARPASPSSADQTGDAGVAATTTIDYASRTTPRRFSEAALLLVVLLMWTLASYIIWREHILKFWWDRSFLDESINPLVLSRGPHRYLMPVALFGRYVALLIAPLRLSPDYGGGAIGAVASATDPYFWIGAASAIAIAAACLVAANKRAHAILFCLLAFAILFGLVSNLVSLIGIHFAERLMYIPSAFVCILAGITIAKLPRRAMIAAAVAVLLLFSARTITYARLWNDPVALYSTSIEHQPKAVQLYLLLAEEYQRRDDMNQALRTAARARDVSPNYFKAWLVSARIALAAGDAESALAFAHRSFDLKATMAAKRMIQYADAALRAQTRPATTRSSK